MPVTQTPSLDQLKRALEISQRIQELEVELAAVFSGGSTPAAVAPAAAPVSASPASAKAAKKQPKQRGGKRFVSPEARAKMAAAQRARWAKYHAEN